MFYRETEFQVTPIGKIPKDWDTAKLSDLSEHITKGTTPTTYGFGYTPTGVNFIKVESIDEHGAFVSDNIPHISQEANEAFSRSILRENDVLFSIAGALGRVAIVTDDILPANTNQALAIVRVKERNRLSVEYLRYFLMGSQVQSFVRTIAIQSQQANINLEHVRNFTVALPSIGEQLRLVGVLSAADLAVAKAGEVIAKTERLKKGLMQELLTKGIGHKEYKQTPIGRIPKEWEVAQLKDLTLDVKNGFASGKRDERGIVQVRMNNLTTDGRLLLDTYLKVPIPENIDTWLLKPNDFLFNNTNSIDLVGKSAIFKGAPFPCTFSNHFTRIRFNENLVLPEWVLYHFITHWEKGYFKSVAIRHVGQAAVHSEYLLRLRTPRPPLLEQQKIMEIFSTLNRKLELERMEKTRLERVKQGLMDLLLTGKIRVKVD